MMTLRKWFVPALAVLAIVALTPMEANAQLGKKGNGGNSGGGKTEPPKKGDDNRGGSRGGGKTEPPTKDRGQSGGGSKTEPPTKGGGKSEPPTKGGGQSGGGSKTEPPTKGGGQSGGGGVLGKGGGNSGGGQSGGGSKTEPPTKGGGQSGGGSKTEPPTKGGGQSGGGGKTEPPTKGGGQSGGGGKTEPPTKGGGQSGGGLGKGGGNSGGGSSAGGSRGGGNTSGGSSGGGTLGGGSRGQGGTSSGGALTRGGGNSGVGYDRSNSQGIQRDNDSLRSKPFEKSQPSRSGNVTYSSRNNVYTPNGSPIKVNTAPVIRGGNSLGNNVIREDRTNRNNPFRSGYCHYNPGWVDNWFYYPYYSFTYYPGHCYPSPFYYYPHVPGYIASIRVVIGDVRFQIYATDHYQWNRPRYGYYGGYQRYDTRYDIIDYQIDNLVTAFERRQVRYMDNMIPRSGHVNVALEDDDDYQMRSEDFYDMLADIVEGTETIEYRVRDVRYGRGQYVVEAEHVYRDPWGRTDTKYHTIVMERDREGYEIAYFRVDRFRPRW